MYYEVSANHMYWETMFAKAFPKVYKSVSTKHSNIAWMDAFHSQRSLGEEAGFCPMLIYVRPESRIFISKLWNSVKERYEKYIPIKNYLATGLKPDHFTLPDPHRYQLRETPFTTPSATYKSWPVLDPTTGAVRWDAVVLGLHGEFFHPSMFSTHMIPALVVRDLRWRDSDLERVTLEIFSCMYVPAVAFVHPCELALRALERKYGVGMRTPEYALFPYQRDDHTRWMYTSTSHKEMHYTYVCQTAAPYEVVEVMSGHNDDHVQDFIQQHPEGSCVIVLNEDEWVYSHHRFTSPKKSSCHSHPCALTLQELVTEAGVLGSLPEFRQERCIFRLSVGM